MNATPASLGVPAQIDSSQGLSRSGIASISGADEMKPWRGKLWAKTPDAGGHGWHPLILHMLDVAAAADAVLAREPEVSRRRIGEILGLEWVDARPWILILIACHDLGKACPSFQMKWPDRPPIPELRTPRAPRKGVRHDYVSQVALTELLRSIGWPDLLAEIAADAVGCHHGSRASEHDKDEAIAESRVGRGERLESVRDDWDQVRTSLFDAVLRVFQPTTVPVKQKFAGPDFMLLAGLTSFSDWIGSNETWFTYGVVADCDDLSAWFESRRRIVAEHALDALGWAPRLPLMAARRSFEEVFPKYTPRPLQEAVVAAVSEVDHPVVLLIEAPMGEGKTEAAFYAHLELQRRFGHRGMYVALPTKATGNAMFKRTREFLHAQAPGRILDLQLLHGGKTLNEMFQGMRSTGIHDPTPGGEIRASEWFTNRKRALLSEYGVGTVDQALLPILPVRHNFVRMWGLANRVVVLDEIHAYDDYTGTLLVDALRWLVALGCSVVLLSATLSPSIRRRLAHATGSDLPADEAGYPRLSMFAPGGPVKQRQFDADPSRRHTLQIHGIPADLPSMYEAITKDLPGAVSALALVNTVQRAQELYRLFPEGEQLVKDGVPVGKRLSDGTEVLLFHARFPADQRQVREENAVHAFGKDEFRTERRILIATQVAEQSLDLDFDVMVTDLAPIDLLLQRAGRLWRHKRGPRPVNSPILLVAGLLGDEPPSFMGPLWWGKVYREDLLLKTWALLRDMPEITLPDEIDPLVRAVYEDEVDVPPVIQQRLMSASTGGEGIAFAQRQQAKMAIIGFPDDASWNDPSRFVLYDEDSPGVHRTLMAQTRLGQESLLAIPLTPSDQYQPDATPNDGQAKGWLMRAVSLSRLAVVRLLRNDGVPEGWQKSPFLRSCYPLILDEAGRWTGDESVRLDEDLGLVYGSKEAP